mgnify:CR=1 FL=1
MARVSPGWLQDGSRRREAISETGDEYARRRLLPTTSNLRVVGCVQPLRSITAGAEYAYMYSIFSLFAVNLLVCLFLPSSRYSSWVIP